MSTCDLIPDVSRHRRETNLSNADTDASHIDYLKHACLTWELLRIPFNLIILAVGLAVIRHVRGMEELSHHTPSTLESSRLWGVAIVFGLFANLFYCFGPLIEAQFALIFWTRIGRGRYVLFALGTLAVAGFLLIIGDAAHDHLMRFMPRG